MTRDFPRRFFWGSMLSYGLVTGPHISFGGDGIDGVVEASADAVGQVLGETAAVSLDAFLGGPACSAANDCANFFADDGFERFGRQTLAHRAVLVFAVVF
ncbi:MULTISPECIES: hypothetical protein [Haloarcula]|jgi:hypothetical protein|uniref:hypothetical protein n=1 Tax=Haloarcula TaxID=2237 RepID=UPI0007BB1208|nr:hypothetical protein [Haloarcula sp. K1]KZX49682.1 hypothetical protein AV929_18415 [Haloarcula sp. K1]